MRFLLAAFIFFFMTVPAWAGFNGPSAASKQADTAVEAVGASEGTTCVLTGNIIEHLNQDRYTFRDNSGTIVVNIPPHVFGALEITPKDTVRVTGEIRGKKDPARDDTHLGVRYIEVINQK